MLNQRLKNRLNRKLNKSKKILWIGASLIALCGSSIVFAAPADQGRALVSDQVQQQVNINSASASELASSLKGRRVKDGASHSRLSRCQWCFSESRCPDDGQGRGKSKQSRKICSV